MGGYKQSGLAAALAVAFAPAIALASSTALAPFGNEFTVSEGAEAVQRAPSVASNAFGGIVVAWQAVGSGSSQIRSSRFSATGNPFGGDITVGAGTDPAAAMSAVGAFVIAYNGSGGQRFSLFDVDGDPVLADHLVDANGSTAQPTIAMDADGNFITAYLKTVSGTNSIVARRFDATGVQQGSDIVVSGEGANSQPPVVTMASDGHFAVAYIVNNAVVRARLFNPNGTAVAPAFNVNQAAGAVSNVKAAVDGSGNAIFAWSRADGTIDFRVFGADGTPITDEFQAAAPDAGSPPLSIGGISMSATGDTIVLTYDSRGGGPSASAPSDIFARSILPPSAAFKVNSSRPRNHQLTPAIALDADGDFTIVWQNGDTAAGADVQAQRFVGARNVDLSLTIADSPDPVVPGATVTYTYSANNLHPVTDPGAAVSAGLGAVFAAIGSAHNVVISATLPAGVSNVHATGTGWDCDVGANPVICVSSDLLLANTSSPVSLSMTTPSSGTSLQASGQTAAYQFDAALANNVDAETTTLGKPTVQFATATQSVNEPAGTVHVTVTLSSASPTDTTVQFAADPSSTAQVDSDYTLPASPLTIPAGATSADIVVTIVNNTVQESSETLVLKLSSPSGNVQLGAAATDTITIVDNDTPPTVQFAQASESASEGAGSVTIVVQLSAASDVDVVIPFAVSGTAQNGTDYTTTPTPLLIAAGQTSGNIVINLLDDPDVENAETVVLTLGTPENATLGATTTNTLTIANNDATVQGASGEMLTFSTSAGSITDLALVPRPASPPAGMDYPEGFFSYEISGVGSGGIVTLTVLVPAGTDPTDWIDCPDRSCFRVTKSDSTDPGNAQFDGDVITVHIQDNGPLDDDPRPGIISAVVAPGKANTNESGAFGWFALLPLFAAAGWRRRPIRARR